MSEPDDRELEDFLEGRSEISRVYAEGAKRQSSPPAADLAIRNLAREDLRRVAHGGWDRARYLRPLALAACLVLALAVFLQVRDEPERLPSRSDPIRTRPDTAAPAAGATAPEAKREEPQASPAITVEPDSEARREAPVVTQPLRSLRDLGAESGAGAAAPGEAQTVPPSEPKRQAVKPLPKASPDLRASDAPATAPAPVAAPAPASPPPAAAGAAAAPPRSAAEAEAAPRRMAPAAETLAVPAPPKRRAERTKRASEADTEEFFTAPEDRKAEAAVPLKTTTPEEQLDEIRAMASNNLPAARIALKSWRAANAQAEIPEDLAWMLPESEPPP